MAVVVATVTAPVPAVRPKLKTCTICNTSTKGDVARTSTSGDGRVRTKCHTASTKVAMVLVVTNAP